MERSSEYFEKHKDSKMENYLDLTLREAYNLITSASDPWPNKFRTYKKVKFIDQLIEYFTELEEYERCAKLVQIKNSILNELDNRK
tara:strand:- start:1149 stop:1406 length:258 start_codon:yes stop_codon:yes gene_type:complete